MGSLVYDNDCPPRPRRARIALTRIALTRIALTRTALTRIALTRIALTRIALTRHAYPGAVPPLPGSALPLLPQQVPQQEGP